MDYKSHYIKLIEKAKNRSILKNQYKEKHHIIPKSIGGDDSEDNLVELFPEEHLIAHLLLVKINPESSKLLYAANIMTSSNGHDKQFRNNNKRYGWLKKKYSEMMQENMNGENNHRFGVEMSQETKDKISNANSGKSSYWKGKELPKEVRTKISLTRKNQGIAKGELNPMYGKNHTEESKIQISENRKGKAVGVDNGMFGKTHTDLIKFKLRDKNLKMWKVTDLETGLIWIGKEIDIFCKENNLNKGSLQDVARARRKNPNFEYKYKKRWICEYYEKTNDCTH